MSAQPTPAFDSDMNLTSAEYRVFPAGILTLDFDLFGHSDLPPCHVAGGGGAHVAPLEVLAPPPLVAFLAFLAFFGTSLSSDPPSS